MLRASPLDFRIIAGRLRAASALAASLLAIGTSCQQRGSIEEGGQCPDIPETCMDSFLMCQANPKQPRWNRRTYGEYKDCAACLRQCKIDHGIWPGDKCPP